MFPCGVILRGRLLHWAVPDPVWLMTTPRLVLRRFTADDLDWLATLYSDEDVARYLGGVKDRDSVEAMLQVRILDYYEQNPGLGLWLTCERVTGAPVGFHLLCNIQGETIIQVGFGLMKSAWGRGYGTEMAAEVLRYGFETLALPRIVAIANLDNHPSQHVLRKIGLHRHGERSFPHPAYASQGPLAWFERDRDAWMAELSARVGAGRARAIGGEGL
jgi:ribosomal-protein-alanine N-acetyltransferase